MRGGCEDGGSTLQSRCRLRQWLEIHCRNGRPSPRPAVALLFDSAESLLLAILASFEIFSVERGFLRQNGGASELLLRKSRGKYHVSCVARIWPRHWSSRALGKTRPDAGQQAGAKCATLASAHTSSQCRATSRQLLRPGRYQSPRPRPRRALPRQGTAEGRSRLWCRPVTRHRARVTRSRCSAVRASVPLTL
jgi:hypothetical protein